VSTGRAIAGIAASAAPTASVMVAASPFAVIRIATFPRFWSSAGRNRRGSAAPLTRRYFSFAQA
jgi:hypothetical protein